MLVLYDTQHVYVAFRAWDPEPLTAQLTQRDSALDRDDAVGLMIDTFDDRQTAYFFAVNVLGMQADARIADDGRTTDFTWDAPWRAATRRTAEGWTAEMSLPLTSITCAAGENRTWGIRHSAGVNEGSIGVDANLLFGRTFNFTGQWLGSYGRYSHGTGSIERPNRPRAHRRAYVFGCPHQTSLKRPMMSSTAWESRYRSC